MAKKKAFSLSPVPTDRPTGHQAIPVGEQVEPDGLPNVTFPPSTSYLLMGENADLAGRSLDDEQRERYDTCKQVIREGMATFLAVGEALAEIRDRGYYLTDYDTFEAFCQQEYDISRRRAYQLMDATDVVTRLSLSGEFPPAQLPLTESHAVALASVEPERRREVWDEVVAVAQHEKTKITAAEIARTNERLTGKPARKPTKKTSRKEDAQADDQDAASDVDNDQDQPTQRTEAFKREENASPTVSAVEPTGDFVNTDDQPSAENNLWNSALTAPQGSFQGQSIGPNEAAIERVRRAKCIVLEAEIQIQVAGTFILRNELTVVWHQLRGHQAIIDETYVDTLSYSEAIEIGLL